MADPTDPTTSNNIDATTSSINEANSAFDTMNQITNLASTALSSISNKTREFGINLQSTTSLTEGQATAFGAFAAGAINAGKAFDNFGNFDTSGLNTLGGQIESIKELLLKQSPAVQLATTAYDKFIASGEKNSVKLNILSAAVATAKDSVIGMAQKMVASSDQALKLQNGFLQLSASTGSLDEVFKAAGPNLENLNLLMDDQRHMMERSIQATGLSAEQVSKYYGTLGTVHGALGSVIKSGDGSSKTIDMLTASIQFSIGSGRKYEDFMQDMKLAFKDYGIEGEKAAKFTLQMGEIANKTGVDLEDVRTALRNTADSFKMFGDESNGAANMMNNYLESLKRTGISGGAAITVVQDMTSAIQGMGIEQKAFLSQQTGGPGGLMGAFQIDKMLKEGKLDEVMEKVRKQMTQMMGGQLVSLEEAGQSQSGAAQMAKQVAMLRQGPMGSIAKSDQEAYAILGSFKEKQTGGAGTTPTALNQNIVQETAKKGNMLLEKQDTKLSQMRGDLQRVQLEAQGINLNTKELLFTARGGRTLKNEPQEIKDMRQRLQDNMKKATESGSETEESTTRLKTGNMKETNRQASANAIKDIGKFIEEVPLSIKAPFEEIKALFSSGASGEKIKDTYEGHLEDIKKRKEAVSSSQKNATQKKIEMSKLEQEENSYKKLGSYLGGSPPNGLPTADKPTLPSSSSAIAQAINNNQQKLPSAPVRVAQAAASASSRQSAINANLPSANLPTAIPAHGTASHSTSTTEVHITAYCAACHQLIHSSPQSNSNNAAATKL